MNTLDILFAICICVMAVMAVLFVGSLWMQARNNAVYSFRGGLLREAHSVARRLGENWELAHEWFEACGPYEDMVWRPWKQLSSFVPSSCEEWVKVELEKLKRPIEV